MMTSERRTHERVPVEWAVDCVAGDNFLYASIGNIGAMGLFVRTTQPLPVGTELELTFTPPKAAPLRLRGKVQWINPVHADGDNPNPGMGVQFFELSSDDRERLVELVRAIAYVDD